MARTVKFVPHASPSAIPTLALDAIPQDVRDEVEEIYAALKANPNGRMRAEFSTKDEALAYQTQATAYCALRTVAVKNEDTGKVEIVAAPIRFRKSPTKGLADNVLEFRITDLKTENEEKTEAIRDAVNAVKDAAKNGSESAGETSKPATPAKATGKAAKAA